MYKILAKIDRIERLLSETTYRQTPPISVSALSKSAQVSAIHSDGNVDLTLKDINQRNTYLNDTNMKFLNTLPEAWFAAIRQILPKGIGSRVIQATGAVPAFVRGS